MPLLDAEGYEPAAADQTVQLDGEGVYLSVRPKAALLTGYVRAAVADGQPIEGATVTMGGSQREQ